MSEENKALVRRFTEEMWTKGNFSIVDELMSLDLVFHNATGVDIHGSEEFKKNHIAARKAFPDIDMGIDDLIAEGDKVVARWTLQGTHTAEFRGIPPTGKKLRVWGINIFRLSGGKIVEIWDRYDTLGMMQQLGVIPKR